MAFKGAPCSFLMRKLGHLYTSEIDEVKKSMGKGATDFKRGKKFYLKGLISCVIPSIKML